MSKFSQKVVSVALALATVASLSGSLPVAHGATLSAAEIQAMIASLTAQLATLQSQLTATTGTTTVTSYNFTKDLTIGASGDDVKALQGFLIAQNKGAAAAKLATYGATGYFGSATKAALAEYQAARSISPAAGYFGPLTRADVKAVMASATPTTPTTPTTPVGTPSSWTFVNVPVTAVGDVPQGATGVVVSKFDVTAPAAGTLNSIVVTRRGVGSVTDISRIYVYEGDTRLTTGKTLSSDTNAVEISSLNLSFTAGQKRTFSLIVDVNTAAGIAGNNDYLEVTSASASTGTVTGLPVSGSSFRVAASAAATLAVANSGSTTAVKIGDANAVLANFSLTPANEHVTLKRVVLRQMGTADLSTFTDWKLYDTTGTVLGTGTVSGRYVTFSGLNYVISNGTQRNFDVKATVGLVSNPGVSTVSLAVDQASDVYATGNNFGYGARLLTGANAYASGDYTEVAFVVNGGRMTFAMLGPAATNVAVNSQDVVLMEFSISPTISGYIDSLSLNVYADDDADGDPFDSAGDGADNEGLIRGAALEANLKDIKIKRKSDGVTVWGPQELGSTAQGAGDVNDAIQTIVYGEDINFTAGTPVTYQVTADVDNNMPASVAIGAALVNNGLTAWDTNGNRIAATDVVPAITALGGIRGNIMTTSTASLGVAMAATPTSQTIVGGQVIDAAGFVMSAGAASKVTISSITINGYGDTGGDASYTGAEFPSVVSSATLWAGTGSSAVQLGTAVSPDTSGNLTFSGFSREIAAGQSETWVLKATPDTTLTNAGGDTFYVDITGGGTVALTGLSANVNAVDKDGNPISAANALYGGVGGRLHLNGTGIALDGGVPSTVVTVGASGTLQVVLDGTTADSQLVIAGTSANELSKYRFASLRETFSVKTLAFANLTAAGVPAATANVTTVSIYGSSSGTPTLIASGSMDSTGVVRFSNENGLFSVVPGSPFLLVVKTDLAQEGAGTTGAVSGTNVRTGIYLADDNAATDFRVVGVNSSTALQETDAASNNTAPVIAGLTFTDNTSNADSDADSVVIAGNNMILRKTKPVVTKETTTATLTNGTDTMIKFRVAADAASDVSWKRMVFSYGETGTFTASNWRLYRDSTDISANVSILNTLGTDIEAADIAVADGATTNIIVRWNTTLEDTISKGTSRVYELRADVAGAGTGESATTSLVNDTTASAAGGYTPVSLLGGSARLIKATDATAPDTAIFLDVSGDTSLTTAYANVAAYLAANTDDHIISLDADGDTVAADLDNAETYAAITASRFYIATDPDTPTQAALMLDVNGDSTMGVIANYAAVANLVAATTYTDDLVINSNALNGGAFVSAGANGTATLTRPVRLYTATDPDTATRVIVMADVSGDSTLGTIADFAGVANLIAAATYTDDLIVHDNSKNGGTFVSAGGNGTATQFGTSKNFIWSDNSADLHSVDSTDWANGFYVNVPTSTLSDVRQTLSL